MKLKNKTIASLLTMALLLASVQVLSTSIVHAGTTLTFLTHWSDTKESGYWAAVAAKYEAVTGVHIDIISVTFDLLLQEIRLRHASGTDTDLISFYDMWLPEFANHVSEVVAPAPADIVADVTANWQSISVAPSMFKGILYGYPTEYDCWSLVYNRKVFQDAIDAGQTQLQPILNKLESKDPLTWDELDTAGRALTTWDTTVSPPVPIITGFAPMALSAQGRFQWLSLLWSNGGDYYDLSVPEVLFDTPNAVEAMQLLSDLGYVEPRAYDPMHMPDFWWTAWSEETVGMMLLPTWMNYIMDAMPGYFDHLGVAPIPYNADRVGTQSVSNSYGWMVGVSQKAQDEGRAGAAWDFLRWLYEPRAAGYIESPDYMPEAYGVAPKGSGCSIMGDWLIFDFTIPSKIADQQNGHITVGYWAGHGEDGGPITNDFWLSGYMDVANTYGRPTDDNLKSAQQDAEINLMFDRVIQSGGNPAVEVHDAALRVQAVLPMSGDVNLDDTVNIQDVPLIIADIDATPAVPQWTRGRSEFAMDPDTKEYVIDVLDITVLSTNYGRTSG